MAESLLAHLAGRFGTGPENLATEALAYILRERSALGALTEHARRFCPDLPGLTRVYTQASGEDRVVPDLVGETSALDVPLVIEAKFDAMLTPNQPVAYLHRLFAVEGPTLLLFLVPTRRQVPLWQSMQRRCADAGLTITEVQPRLGTVGGSHLAITTWNGLLDDLRRATTSAEEIDQLAGLCRRQAGRAFRPFTDTFLDPTTAQHLGGLDEIIAGAVDLLVAQGAASTKRLAWSGGRSYFGRYVSIEGWQCYLHVNFTRWKEPYGPLWLRITDSRATGRPDLMDALRPLAAHVPPRLVDGETRRQIPIHLTPDVERDDLLADVGAQLSEVAELLAGVPRMAESESEVVGGPVDAPDAI